MPRRVWKQAVRGNFRSSVEIFQFTKDLVSDKQVSFVMLCLPETYVIFVVRHRHSSLHPRLRE
jgi:hypothetical protein